MFFSLKFLGKRYNSYLKTKTNISTAYSVATFKCKMIKIPRSFCHTNQTSFFQMSWEVLFPRLFIFTGGEYYWKNYCTQLQIILFVDKSSFLTHLNFLWMISFLKSFCSFSEKLTLICIHGDSPGKNTGGVAMPSSRGSSRAKDWTHVSCISCIPGKLFISRDLICVTYPMGSEAEEPGLRKWCYTGYCSCYK